MSALADPPTLVPPAPPRGRARPAAIRDPASNPLDPLPMPRAGRLTLGGANWAVYRSLRDDPRNDGYKITYDGPTGRLEIEMSLGYRHETVSRLLYAFVLAFRQAGGPRFKASGGVTLAREDLDRGLECDESFYITHVDAAPAPNTNLIDLNGDQPPPDLALEVDVTNPGISKLPIYAALGVPEVWVWADDALTARRLHDRGEYDVTADSVELPGFPLAFAAELLRDRGDRDDGDLQQAFAARLRGDG